MIHSNQQHIGDTTLHHTLISLTVFVFIKTIIVRDVYRIEKNMKYTKKRRGKFGFWIFDSTFARLIDRLIVLGVLVHFIVLT